jgi:hypothetical protein
MIHGGTRPRPGSCSKLCSSCPVSLGATTGIDREVEPAVGESFVMMSEEQFAPMRRENTMPRRRAQLVSSLTPGMAGTPE